VGTVTAFIHQFLALPHLRGLGVPVRMVDDDTFVAEALRGLWSDRNVRSWLRHQRDPEIVAESLALDPRTMSLSATGGLPRKGPVRSALERIRSELTGKGLFLYSDLVAVARLALERRPALAERISSRFPVVFVDEAQDTAAEHIELLRVCFSQAAVQWIGDCNQNLYGAGDGKWAPTTGYIDLGGSMRFGHRTAAFASALTMARRQVIAGVEGRDVLHAVVLFDRDTIADVIPAYASLLAATGEFPGPGDIWAVAARHKVPTEARQAWPNCIGDYWTGYVHPKPERDEVGTLAGVLREARRLVLVSGSPQDALSAFAGSVFRFLRRAGWQPDVTARSQQAQWRALETAHPGSQLALRSLLKTALTSPLPHDEDGWKQLCLPLVELVAALAKAPPDDRFLAFRPFAAEGQTNKDNVYVWEDGNRQLNVRLGTIHSVKGQTHDATLVLETNEGRMMDVAKALHAAFADSRATGGPQLIKALTNVFVGATRPRRALCLATRREALGELLEKSIRDAGWRVHDLTVRTTRSK
jgi:hypothetical protein